MNRHFFFLEIYTKQLYMLSNCPVSDRLNKTMIACLAFGGS